MQNGRCLCGKVQYEFDETQVGFGLHCHCKDCQRVTGSGKATVILFPLDAVKIEGEYKTYASLGFEGSHVNRGFCPNCGSQMFTFEIFARNWFRTWTTPGAASFCRSGGHVHEAR